MRADRASVVAALAIAAAFAVGVIELFQLRFEAGDVYPPYSSLRSDPLGAMALFESLESLPGLKVARNYRPLARLKGAPCTIFYLGTDPRFFGFRPELDEMARSGARVVVGFAPVTMPANAALTITVKEWAVRFAFAEAGVGNDQIRGIPRSTALHFTVLDQAWNLLSAEPQRPSMIERRLDKGTLVLVASAFPFSNEALVRERRPDLIARLTGGSDIVFDEQHFGILESGSVTSLARKYGLTGLAAGLLLLAALYLWRNSVSFVPPLPETPGGGPVSGRDAASGFVNLLRRAVEPAELLEVCHQEWKKSLGLGKAYSERRIQKVDEMVAARGTGPVSRAKAIVRVLQEKQI
ncbi:MAG: DUF4350 domain-containing protein [Bryobacteraceae bacterium]